MAGTPAAFEPTAFENESFQTGAGEVTTPTVTPSGGWARGTAPGLGQRETAEQRRRERERLGIEPPQQRAIDRAAVKIARSMPGVGLAAPQEARRAVLAAPAFDALLMTLRPSEGEILALAQAILDRLAWMQAEQEDEEAIVRLMMEMD